MITRVTLSLSLLRCRLCRRWCANTETIENRFGGIRNSPPPKNNAKVQFPAATFSDLCLLHFILPSLPPRISVVLSSSRSHGDTPCPPLSPSFFISREDARFQSLSRRSRGRRDGRTEEGPPTCVERNKTPPPFRVRLTPRLWVPSSSSSSSSPLQSSPVLCPARPWRRPRPEASFFFVPAVRTAARQVLRDLFYGVKERTRGYFTPQISGGTGQGARGKSAN